MDEPRGRPTPVTFTRVNPAAADGRPRSTGPGSLAVLTCLITLVMWGCGTTTPDVDRIAPTTSAVDPDTPRPSASVPRAAAGAPGAASQPGDTKVGTPAIVLRVPTVAGFDWSLLAAGRPKLQTPLEVDTPEAELGPASPAGLVLTTSDRRVVVSRLDGATLSVVASWTMPARTFLVPACFTGDGRPMLADTETLALVIATDDRFESVGVARTLGECAALTDGRLLVSIEGGRLLAVDADGVATPVVGAPGRHLSAGGGLVAMTDPTSELGGAVVQRAAVAADGTLGPLVGRVDGRTDERVVNAQLSPDGAWLAISSERGSDAGQEGRLLLYRVGDGGLVETDDISVPIGTRMALLPAP